MLYLVAFPAGYQNSSDESKAKMIYTVGMDEGRKRVIGVMAAILASLHRQTANDLLLMNLSACARPSHARLPKAHRTSPISAIVAPRSATKAVRLPTGIAFTFRPECCSESQRNGWKKLAPCHKNLASERILVSVVQ